MDVAVMPGMIDQYRETFEGRVENHGAWITDGKPEDGVFGTISPLSAAAAFAEPVAGARSIAAHVKHLQFSLELLHQRMHGADPKADWKSSFNLPPVSEAAWQALQADLRNAYEAVLNVIQQQRQTPPEKMPAMHLVGLCATVAHNAYHLGAIRQIAKVVAR